MKEKKQDSTFKFMTSFTGKSRKGFIIGYVLLFLGAVFAVLLPQVVKYIIDYVFSPGGSSEGGLFDGMFSFLGELDPFMIFYTLIAVYLIITLIKNIIYYIRQQVIITSSRQVFGNVRTAILQKFTNLDKIENEGETFMNLTYGGMHIVDILSEIIPYASEYLMLASFALIFLFLTNAWIGLVVAVVVPIFVLIEYFYIKKSYHAHEKQRIEEEGSNMMSEQYVTGIKAIRQMGYEDIATEKFAKQCDREFEARREGNRYINRYGFFLNLVRAIAFAAVLILSGLFALRGDISVGDFVTLGSYSFTVFSAIGSAVSLIFSMQEGLISVGRVRKFLEIKTKVDMFKSKEFVMSSPNISIQKLGFSSDDDEVLKNISFDIPYGTSVGITGMQGSGKSLIGKLLLRIVEPTRGGISVNKTDIKEININSLRGQFSYQPQMPYIFNDTIKSNIVLFDKSVDEERLRKVIKVVGLGNFIRNQPDKLNTVLLGSGTGVPKQETQKINLARALYRGAPVLLLDSPIRHFDAEDSMEVMKNIFLYYYGKTIVVLSSNPSEMMLCDNVIFLRDGKIVEQGSPEQLLELNGHFARAYNKQKEWSGIN